MEQLKHTDHFHLAIDARAGQTCKIELSKAPQDDILLAFDGNANF